MIRQDWDVIVVGTGIGGAVFGHSLARRGWRVLFCEAGRSPKQENAITGTYPELLEANPEVPNPENWLARAGRCHIPLLDVSLKHPRSFVPFVGFGVGGSSALFGMAMERFFPADFERSAALGADGLAASEGWPVNYEEMAPFYTAAEKLFRVRGGADPLRPVGESRGLTGQGPGLTESARDLAKFASARGLHPYQLPLACEFVEGCSTCQGYLCQKDCKNDAGRICIEPAVASFGAELLTNCRATLLEADGSRVTGVLVRHFGQTFRLKAQHVVLAAGALHSPEILLRSASGDWPHGLANRSGMVGRNLMRHLIDLYVIKAQMVAGTTQMDNSRKELAFNDLYVREGLGSVQSFGRLPPPQMILADMKRELRSSAASWVVPLLSVAGPFIRPVLRSMFADSLILAATLPDSAHPDNRVGPALDSGLGVRLTYRPRPEDLVRLRRFRERMREILHGLRWRRLAQAENNERIAHVCGTCRFGNDPQNSVLDRWNKAHDLANLHVVDASFFPSSGGTNPSLTIAANALRVASAWPDPQP